MTIDRRDFEYVLGRLRRRFPDDADVEDHLHSAYERLKRYQVDHEVRDVRAFLSRTAQNIRIDAARRRGRHVDGAFDSLLETAPTNEPLQDEVFEARERLRRVRAALERLPERTRTIFLMHRLDGMKYREIAKQLGISQSAVEKHIAKAMLQLGRHA